MDKNIKDMDKKKTQTDYGLVSIITPNYNCGRYIEQTINSVLKQSYRHWEMLIQDDCSTDGSYETALNYMHKDSRIKVERNERNCGAAATRNNAIRRSNGQWLAFLDSDDLWKPEKLELQLKWMKDNGCDFSFTEYELIDETGMRKGILVRTTKRLTYKKELMHSWPGCLTVIYKQNKLAKIYSPDTLKSNDRALFLKVLKHSKNACGIPISTAYYRKGCGISSNKWKMMKAFVRTTHEFERVNLAVSYMYYFTHIIIRLFKYKKIRLNYEQRKIYSRWDERL